MSPDPYAKSDEPAASPLYDTVLTGLRKINSTMNLVIGGAFVLTGLGFLIAAAITREPFLLPAALFTLFFGAVRIFLGRR